MGSWNSICVTIPTDSPEEFVEELETILQQEWSDLKGAVEVPADVEGLLSERTFNWLISK